jgi:hypothetical protein
MSTCSITNTFLKMSCEKYKVVPMNEDTCFDHSLSNRLQEINCMHNRQQADMQWIWNKQHPHLLPHTRKMMQWIP